MDIGLNSNERIMSCLTINVLYNVFNSYIITPQDVFFWPVFIGCL
jgi:hypothetical protein